MGQIQVLYNAHYTVLTTLKNVTAFIPHMPEIQSRKKFVTKKSRSLFSLITFIDM
jgi:hypothetical protein